MKSPSVLVLSSLATLSGACCGVAAHGASVRFTGQTNIVVWDAARGIEHFVRDARFESKGPSLGFIAPTPGRPTLSEADAAAFATLAALDPDPTAGIDTKSGTPSMDTAASVEVVQVQDVAGYRATVLKATDGAALGAWLEANGYPSPTYLPKWSEPYVSRGWYLTAFKVTGKSTGPIRMSFKTDRAFNPYAVPEENAEDAALLRLFYVSSGSETPRIGGRDGWIPSKWSTELPASTAAQLASQLKLAPDDLPKGARVTLYEDRQFGRPGRDDLYFVPDGDSRGSLAVGGAAVALLAVALRRRRPEIVSAS